MNELLIQQVDWEKVEAVLYADTKYPFQILGPRVTKNGIQICCFYPNAKAVSVKEKSTGTVYEMEDLELEGISGFFGVIVEKEEIFKYTYVLTSEDGHVWEQEDAYAFLPELPEEELNEVSADDEKKDDKLTLIQSAKLLFTNKYYVMICFVYILQQLYGAMINIGIYFMTYVLLNKNLFGVFSWAINIPLIIALIFTPTLVAKWKGMYKLNKYSYMVATVGRLLVVVAGYMGSVPLMLLFTAIAALGQGPWQGDMNAVIASCSEYTYLKTGKRIDGTMYSCTSLGVKIGGGLGTALAGWMLDLSGFINGDTAIQPDSCISMMYFMYLWLPFILDLLITIILSFMNVEEANDTLKAEKKVGKNKSVPVFRKFKKFYDYEKELQKIC